MTALLWQADIEGKRKLVIEEHAPGMVGIVVQHPDGRQEPYGYTNSYALARRHAEHYLQAAAEVRDARRAGTTPR